MGSSQNIIRIFCNWNKLIVINYLKQQKICYKKWVPHKTLLESFVIEISLLSLTTYGNNKFVTKFLTEKGIALTGYPTRGRQLQAMTRAWSCCHDLFTNCSAFGQINWRNKKSICSQADLMCGVLLKQHFQKIVPTVRSGDLDPRFDAMAVLWYGQCSSLYKGPRALWPDWAIFESSR